jgi:hypothetical protein
MLEDRRRDAQLHLGGGDGRDPEHHGNPDERQGASRETIEDG